MESLNNLWLSVHDRLRGISTPWSQYTYRPLAAEPSTSALNLPLPAQAQQNGRRKPNAAYLTVLFPLFVFTAGWYIFELRQVETQRNPSYLIEAQHGAAATENQLCSVLGVNVLKDGGNAVDAAVASTLCIGVVNMFS